MLCLLDLPDDLLISIGEFLNIWEHLQIQRTHPHLQIMNVSNFSPLRWSPRLCQKFMSWLSPLDLNNLRGCNRVWSQIIPRLWDQPVTMVYNIPYPPLYSSSQVKIFIGSVPSQSEQEWPKISLKLSPCRSEDGIYQQDKVFIGILVQPKIITLHRCHQRLLGLNLRHGHYDPDNSDGDYILFDQVRYEDLSLTNHYIFRIPVIWNIESKVYFTS